MGNDTDQGVFKTYRIRVHQLCILVFLGLLATGTSYWTAHGILVEELLYMLGIVMVAVGVLGRVWSLSVVAGRKNTELVTDGPYSICRNPLYLFSLSAVIGIGLCTGTLTYPLILAALFMAYYLPVIAGEERKLLARHKEAYKAYCASTPRLMPSLRNYRDSGDCQVRSTPLREGLRDLLPIFVALGMIEVSEGLHQTGVLDTVFFVF